MNTQQLPLFGKIAVITGASGGVGYATCIRLAQQGATVIGLVRNIERATQLFSQLANPKCNHMLVQADITETAQIKIAVSKIANQFGKCDMLVNAAGSTQSIPHKELLNLTDDIFNKIININLVSIFAVIREFSELLRISNDGLIINISSVAGIRIGGSNLAYAAAKAGIESLTRNLSIALAPSIRIISVAPSYMDTGFIPGSNTVTSIQQAQQTPLGRNVTPDDVAAVVESCATTMKFITGQCITVDGGRSL